MSTVDIKYKIDFYSDWICSSGLTGQSDNLPIVDIKGTPFIPGKTLKGLLREAAEHFRQFSNTPEWSQMIEDCFGTSDKGYENKKQCYFSNASLSQKMQNALDNENKEKNKLLFRDITATQLDEHGQAKDHSLRSVTVVVPLTLFAAIEQCPKEHHEKMRWCLKWVKHIGSLRNRGFGRCKLEELV